MKMDGFCYICLTEGKGHRPLNVADQLKRLSMSVFSLRKHWSGPICVMTNKPCDLPPKVLEQCEAIVTEVPSWNVLKTHIEELSPYDRTIYLDNDTIPVGDLAPLFPGDGEEIVLTSWCRSDSRQASRRMAPWVDNGRLNLKIWERMRDAKVLLYNTGVFGIRKGFSLTQQWRAYTDWFNEDEIALQTLLFETGKQFRVESILWNYQVALWRRVKGKLPEEVRLWHYIGNYVRPINPEFCALKIEMQDAGWLEMTDLDRHFSSV